MSAPVELGDVWAPRARRVELVVRDGPVVELVRDSADVWRGGGAHLGPGVEYRFRLDGRDELPDPRSRWLPTGPTGWTRVDDPGAFRWTDARFEATPWPRAVISEVHVGTFSDAGTFRGAIEHLDELVDLGVTHVELMPIGAWAGGPGWGYDGVAWWAPHAPYGDPDDLRALVDAAHGRGLAVLLDLVVNHLGPEGAVLDRFGPYTVDADTPWGRAVNLDGVGAEQVRAAIVDGALGWLRDLHLDGLRLDAVHALVDGSPRHLVAELTAAVDDLAVEQDRDLVVVAEWDRHDPVPVDDRRDGGWGCRAHWADDLHHALHVALTGESQGYYADAAASPDPIREALRDVYVPRRATGDPAREQGVGERSRTSFVVCLQNHDQVGNRAAGERITHLASLDAVMAAVPLVLLGPSVPLLFQGEEWAASTPFPYFAGWTGDLARAVTEGRRAEFPDHPWDDVADPCDPATVRGAVLDRSEVGRSPHGAARSWYRALLRLRASEADLWAGAPCTVDDPAPVAAAPVVLRRGRFTVVCNLGREFAPAPAGELVLRWGVVDPGARIGALSAGVLRS